MKKILSILIVLCAAVIAVSCSSDIEIAEEQGYLKIELKTLVSTKTRATNAPADYAPRTIAVEVRNSAGTVVASTDDFDNDTNFKGHTFVLPVGTYTITAHSAGWDGSGSGVDAPYYYGTTSIDVESKHSVTASLTLTQNNVKVTVNWDESFTENFTSATSTVSSNVAGVAPISFVMGQNNNPAYFPVSNLTLRVDVTNGKGKTYYQENTIEGLKARDHVVVTYALADAGKEGGISVFKDETTHTYSWTIEIPRKSKISLQATNPNAWSTFANLGCTATKAENFDDAAVTLQYKKTADADWTTVANGQLTTTETGYTYKLTGLTPATAYTCRFVYEKSGTVVNSNEVDFTTESQPVLYNGGFETWTSVSNYYTPNDSGTEYWDTSNPGSASFNFVVTTPETSFVHGGSYSAKLASQYAMIKLAAGSIYTGKFGKVSGTSATLDWGSPFTGRPTALRAYISYSPGSINRGSKPSVSGAPNSGENDYCNVRVALMTKRVTCNNKPGDTFYFPAFDGTDDFVIAHGLYMQNTSDNGQWREVIIPLTYYDTTTKPTHILVAAASSAYGDYFYGSDSSVLYVDDFELIYGDEPTVK